MVSGRVSVALASLALPVIAGTACERGRDSTAMPGPHASKVEEPVRANSECESCHAQIAAEWRASRHQIAGTNHSYVAALEIEPTTFCHECHAPEARGLDTRTARAELGVACVSCHVTSPGWVLASDGDPKARRSRGSDAHALSRTQMLAEPAACAGCHEFRFPGSGRDEPAMMQRTVSEHMRSAFSGVSCAGCHMPVVGSGHDRHRSHAFASVRDPEAMRGALHVVAVRREQSLELTLAPRQVGHAFPTGDLFRRLTITGVARDDRGEIVAERHRHLARHFERRRQSNGRLLLVETYDDRPGIDCEDAECATTLTLDLGDRALGLAIEYRVAYERVEHLQRGSEDLALVGERIVLAEGSL